MVNTSKIKAHMVEKGFTQSKLAACMGIGKNTLNAKLNGKGIFTVSEAEKICEALQIQSAEEKNCIFFASVVPEVERR